MRELTNCYFATGEELELLVNIKNHGGSYRLVGCLESGDRIATSPIMEINDDVVTTRSGSHYKIANFAPEYEAYLNAYAEDIPIIEKWQVEELFSLTLKGEINGEKCRIVPESECGNYIYTASGNKYFVNWLNPNNLQKFELRLMRRSEGLKYPEDFEEFCGMTIKPKLKLEKYVAVVE